MIEENETLKKIDTEESVETVEDKKQEKESRYQTINTICETRESFKKRVDSYNSKYIRKPVEVGRGFVKELQDDPLKRIDTLIEDSTKAVKKLKTDSRKRYEDIRTKSKEISGKVKDSPFKYMGKVVKDAKGDTDKKLEKYKESRTKFLNGVEKDVAVIRKDIWDAGKKALDKVPVKKSVEKRLNATIEKVPSMLNLPSKKEVEELIKGLDNVSKKVDSLGKQPSAV